MVWRGVLMVMFFAAVAFGGRWLSRDIPPRARDVSETVSNQVFGGLRALPLMTLWSRVNDAQRQGRWFDQLALFDLIETLAPNNAAITYYQARVEALSIANDQTSRQAAWRWVSQAFDRLSQRRERLNNNPLLEEGLWDIGFYAGRRFPLEYAQEIAIDAGSQQFAEHIRFLSAQVAERPAITAFLENHGLSLAFAEEEPFNQLTPADQTLLILLERSRWQALAIAAERGLILPRGHSSDLAFKYVISVRRMAALSDSDDSGLLAAARKVLKEEEARLLALGEERRAREFREQMTFLLSPWIGGADGQ